MLTITSNITTRVVDTQWDKGDEIGIYITSSSFGDEGENVMYTTADGDGVFTTSDPFYLPSSGGVNIFAYYPWEDGVDISEYDLDSEYPVDLLSASKSGVTIASSSVELTFNHLLSKISLTIVAGDGLEESDLDDLEVKLSNISTTATFDIANVVVNEGSLGAVGSLELDAASPSAIVIPQELSSATLYFTTEEYGTFCAILSTEEFEVGNEYKYTITISRDGVEITESDINPWDEKTDEGTANIVDLELKKDGKYYINSAKGLAAFRDVVNLNSSNTQNATYAGFDESAFSNSNLTIDGVLTRSIDLSDIYSNESWTTIGYYNSEDCPYAGTFDGGGYEISGVYINTTANQQGLFRRIDSGGVVCNLGISGSATNTNTNDDKTYHQFGGMTAWNDGLIINCYSLVDVDGTGITSVGGIAGYNSSTGKVVNCYNHGYVYGKTNVGGIVGYNVKGYVGYCYSTGDLNDEEGGAERVGGVVGYNTLASVDDSPLVKGSFCLNTTKYSIGQVEFSEDSGGITGNVCTEEYLKSDVFAAVINNGSWTYNDTYNPDIEACAWVDNSTFDYPTLNFDVVNDSYEWIYDIIYSSGTYQIYTALGLRAFAALVNGDEAPTPDEGILVTSGGDDYFKFETKHTSINGKLIKVENSDFDLNDEAWTPIGDSENPYTGTFNGNGNLVEGLNVSEYAYAGLFGSAGSGAEISNLGVDGSVSGDYYVGGVVGENYGTLTNCYNTGSVGGLNSGGVVGYNYGTITNCYNMGSVSGSNWTGGVVGVNSGTLTNCYNAGYVDGSSYAGGVVGHNSGGTITNCFWDSDNSGVDVGVDVGVGDGESDTEGMESNEMKAADFVTTLTDYAFIYNETEPTVAACAWIAGSDGYPTLDFSAEPTMTGWAADAFSSDTYPSYNTWYISDEEITDFSGINAALTSANTNGDITVVFSNIIEIPGYAFTFCTSLTSISLPSAVTIGDNAFIQCTNLTTISLPSAVTIGMCAFGECPNLTTLDLGSSGSGITSIEFDAFYEVTTTNVNLTIKIAEDANGVSVDGNTLTYNSIDTAEFASITVVY